MLKKSSFFFLIFLFPFFVSSKDPLTNSRLFIENLGNKVINTVADKNLDDKIREKTLENYITKLLITNIYLNLF